MKISDELLKIGITEEFILPIIYKYETENLFFEDIYEVMSVSDCFPHAIAYRFSFKRFSENHIEFGVGYLTNEVFQILRDKKLESLLYENR